MTLSKRLLALSSLVFLLLSATVLAIWQLPTSN